MVPTHPHRASHCEIKRLAREDSGVTAVYTPERGGVERGPSFGKRGTGVVDGTAAYYQSPGRLAALRKRFSDAFRQPGLDPATYATNLGMLAIQGFGDLRGKIRDKLIRDKFIDGQEQMALRQQLDGFFTGHTDRRDCGQLSGVGKSF